MMSRVLDIFKVIFFYDFQDSKSSERALFAIKLA